jgi:hypothetical protein
MSASDFTPSVAPSVTPSVTQSVTPSVAPSVTQSVTQSILNTFFVNPIKFQNNLYFGHEKHLTGNFLKSVGVNLIINLTGFDLNEVSYADVLNMSFSADELLPEEMDRGRTKISNVVTKMMSFMADGAIVCLICNTGVNKSPVVLGYYMLKMGMSECEVLKVLHNLSAVAGVPLLTNQSFKKILHRRPQRAICDCWKPIVVEYRSQDECD